MSQGAKARFLFVTYAALKRYSSTKPERIGTTEVVPLPIVAVSDLAAPDRFKALIAIVGVDVEAEDGIDFDGMGASHGRAELPVG
jgi:hypothetical protein